MLRMSSTQTAAMRAAGVGAFSMRSFMEVGWNGSSYQRAQKSSRNFLAARQHGNNPFHRQQKRQQSAGEGEPSNLLQLRICAQGIHENTDQCYQQAEKDHHGFSSVY